MVETVQFKMCIFICSYEVMEFLKNGLENSWESHEISFADLCGNPVIVRGSITISFCFLTSRILCTWTPRSMCPIPAMTRRWATAMRKALSIPWTVGEEHVLNNAQQTRVDEPTQQTQNICIPFIQWWTNVKDVMPTLYKRYTNVLRLLGMLF